jgi:predicted O-methyltransferase YrrM
MTLPKGFQDELQRIQQAVCHVDGWLTDRELSFLALAAACPTTEGTILEIGSYRGRSTIVLARAAALTSQPQIVAVDPLPNEGPLARDPNGKWTARALLDLNLEQAGVLTAVEFHQCSSYELAPRWTASLRLLWIDGDHRYASTKQDFDLFAPYLADGAILAMHDVLSRYDGCIRVFTEDVLDSPHFGAAGLCGSIGWAQYWEDPARAQGHRQRNAQLQARLSPLIPYHCAAEDPQGLAKLRYQLLRAQVPHRKIVPATWLRTVALAG